MQFFRSEGVAAGRGDLSVFADEALDGIGTESPAGAGREERLVPPAGAFGHPDLEDGLAGPTEWDCPMLPAFAFTADAGSVPEGDVTAVEADEFRDSKPGLHVYEQ
jgi:hypothetical protein